MGPCRARAQCRVPDLSRIELRRVESQHRVSGTDAKATQHGERNDPRCAARGHCKHQQQGDSRPDEEEHCGDPTTRETEHYYGHQIRGYIHQSSGYDVQIPTHRQIIRI